MSLPELAPRQTIVTIACRLLGVVGPFPTPVSMSHAKFGRSPALRQGIPGLADAQSASVMTLCLIPSCRGPKPPPQA